MPTGCAVPAVMSSYEFVVQMTLIVTYWSEPSSSTSANAWGLT